MGLLDWNEPSEDDLFPDFEAATPITATFKSRPFHHGSGTSLSTASSAGSTFSTSSQDSSPETYESPPSPIEIRVIPDVTTTDASTTMNPLPLEPLRPRLTLNIPPKLNSTSNAAATPRMHSRPKFRRTGSTPVSRLAKPYLRQRPKSQSFDLFGEDTELQDAESRIGFCEICLKHCSQHV